MAGNYSYRFSRYNKSTYRKRTQKKLNYSTSKRKYTPKAKVIPKKDLYSKDTVRAQDLSGFDKSIYKVDKIIGQVGHGIDILAKPVEGVVNLAKKIFGF